MNPSYSQYSKKSSNSFTSGKRHAPKVMEMRPEIQIYAKQWKTESKLSFNKTQAIFCY